MSEPTPLPYAFDPEGDTIAFLVRAKKRASKGFSWKRGRSLQAACELGYWLHVHQRDDEAIEVCEFLAQFEFAGDYSNWCFIESCIALLARYYRLRKKTAKSKAAAQRIRDVGFVDSRLEGSLLESKGGNAKLARERGDKAGERGWLLIALQELCIIRELGGSKVLTTKRVDAEYDESFQRLRELVKAP